MKTNQFEKKALSIFISIVVIGSIFISALIFFLVLIYKQLYIIGGSIVGKLENLCGCTNHISFTNHPYLFSSLILFGMLTTFFITRSLFRIWQFRRNTRKFIKINTKNSKYRPSEKLRAITSRIGLNGFVNENSQSKPIVFCYGIFRPKICISESVVQKLNDVELEAVLLHEKQHISTHEPAKLFIIRVLEKLLFFLPYYKVLVERYIAFSELAADEMATNGFLNKKPLTQALAKIICWEEQILLRKQLALSFFSAVVDERVNKLTDNNYKPNKKIFTKKFIFSLLARLTLVCALGVFLWSSDKTFTTVHAKQCISNQHIVELPTSMGECNMKHASSYKDCSIFPKPATDCK